MRTKPLWQWLTLAFAAVTLLGSAASLYAAAIPGGTLSPRMVPKYVTPLVIPPEMPAATVNADGSKAYDIEVVPLHQPILPPFDNDGNPLSATPVWSYGAFGIPATRNYPAFTIEVEKDKNAQITWRNHLVDAAGNPLPHLLPVDRSLHWANPEQLACTDGTTRSDCRPAATNGLILQQPYLGPVPIITHVHGAHTGPESDGYPEAWYLPPGVDPALYATEGRLANQFGVGNTGNGAATFNYPNDQKSTTLWYHDHTLGMTRLNVYAGPAGFYLVREANGGETGLLSGTLPGPRPGTDANPYNHLAFREIPIAIQDRSFDVDALGNTKLFYPGNRAFFEGFTQTQQLKIPFVGDPLGSDISPIWNPEFFGNVMVVNGVSWPYLNVEPDIYRFRLLNGCNSRFLNLSLVALDKRGKILGEVPFYQIGAEQGLLPNVVELKTGFATPLPGNGTIPAAIPQANPQSALLMGLAERADVLVDFSALPAGTVKVRMLNTAPDAPFGGFPDIPADVNSTGQVMEFRLVTDTDVGDVTNVATAPASLVLAPMPTPVDPDTTPKQHLALIEEESSQVCVNVTLTGRVQHIDLGGVTFDPMDPNNACALAGGFPFAPKEAVLGTIAFDAQGAGTGMPQMWGDPIRTTPALNSTETWEIWNFTADAHPIHLHLVQFQVLGRESFTPDPLVMNKGGRSGVLTPAEPWETGFKDTAVMYPGMITHVQATFDIAGLYVWHCHIVEHEDNEMMVPYCVQNPTGLTFCGPQDPMPGM